jgi:hypothetical protein
MFKFKSLLSAFVLTLATLSVSFNAEAASKVSPPTNLQVYSACPASSGPLTLNVTTSRSTGISPVTIWFDATATTDTALTNNMTTFQDVIYTWSFGDYGVSGTGTWAYGSNPGHNSKNSANGGVVAHVYNVVDGSGDTSYNAVVTATDGTNTVSCGVVVTAYDASGANGYPGTKTTCVYSSSLGTGCPSGAATASQSNYATAISSYTGSGKRLLFHCGDTFSGDNGQFSGTKSQIGAYGGCENTQTNRPILNETGSTGVIYFAGTDTSVSNLDIEGNGTTGQYEYAVKSAVTLPGVTQFTLYNTTSHNTQQGFYWSGNQVAAVQYVMNGYAVVTLTEGTFGLIGNTCANGSTAYQCGQGSSAVYYNNNYQALIGSDFIGPAGGSGAYETVRVSACQKCFFSNISSSNAGVSYAVFKLHSANPSSQETWIGQYTQYVTISDNLFTGASGGFFTELAPQNSSTDERIRNVVVERNIFAPASTTYSMVISGDNITYRDNIITSAGGSEHPIQFFRRGVEWNNGSVTNTNEPQYLEVYNNTCNGGSQCVQLNSPSHNCFMMDNLAYYSSGSSSLFSSSCVTSTVSNNTSGGSANPAFTNGSSTFLLTSDYKPTANYSGGVAVPNLYDALGQAWSPTWSLGAIHP